MKETGINKVRVVSTTHLTWFFAGFDLVLLPLLAREIGASFFPNIDPQVSILAVYGTLSLSLLARFFGGIVLGAAADNYGRKPIVIICLAVMSTLTLISAFLPSVHDEQANMTHVVVISFITTRCVIGFFVGGIWPTAAIFGMEKLYALDRNKAERSFEELTKKRTIVSAIMQSGFHSGHLIAAFVSLGILGSLGTHQEFMWHNSYFSFKDAFTWRTLSFLGGVFGIMWTVYFRYSEKNGPDPTALRSPIYRKIKSESSLKALITNRENEEYRAILFSFWLILTGILYMYYSVITILPEMFVRNDFLIPYHLSLSNEDYPLVTIFILVSTLVAHLWLGFFCNSAWRWSERWEKSQQMPGGFGFRDLIRLLKKLRKVWFVLIRKIAKYIGIQYAEGTTLDDIHPDVIYKNVDVIIIVFIGFILIICGILGGVSFYFLFNHKPDLILRWLIVIYIVVIFIMIAVSGWALIPSLLSSRFPVHFRATASNLAYNGGLAIGFASPFIMLENFLKYKNEWLIFVPVILGASAMIIGATRFINMKNKPKRLGWIGDGYD